MTMDSLPLAGIGLALASAAALSIGNLLQSRGVHEMEDRATRGATGSKASNLARDRFWLLGALILAVAILLQMGSLTLAPLMVVQPVGVSALIFTTLITAFLLKKRPSRQVVAAIAVCVIGVGVFVSVAAVVSTQHPVTDTQLIAVLVVLVSVLLASGILMVADRRGRLPPIAWVILGGVYSAFVATLGKTVILRVQTALKTRDFAFDTSNLLTIGCIVGIGVAGGLSIYFVQRAHATNRPDVVLAGLTVIDPAVAVVIGITILGEASAAPLWALVAFVVAGAIAVAGVFALSRAENTPHASVASPAGARRPPTAASTATRSPHERKG